MKYFVSAKLSENISQTPEGYLVCIGVPIARTGEQIYGKDETPLEAGPNGTVTIMREEAEVFRPETMASFEGKPVTITHPEEFVNPKNWKQLTGGTMQNIRRGTDDMVDSLLADLLITDDMAINLVKTGLREVSCGYEADYEQEDAGYGFQKNIIGNHLALVDQGRAGSSYAINDHKEGAKKMTLKEHLKNLKAKFADAKQEMADAEAEMKDAMGMAKDDGEQAPPDVSSGKPAVAKDEMKMYDELKKACDALGEKIDAMSKAKDADEDDQDKDKPKADDEDMMDEDGEGDLDSRLKKLEAAVAKLLEREAKEDEVPVGDDDEEIEDDDFDESAMVGDAAFKTTDVASRAEILAPGIAITKDVKVKSLKTAYATKDGRELLKSLSAGKEPAWDKQEKMDQLFIAASEVMKATRIRDNAGTKRGTGVRDTAPKFMTADDINAINAKFYGLK